MGKGAFIIIEPKTDYSFKNIYNFNPFVVAKIETGVQKIDLKRIEDIKLNCMGILYPSSDRVSTDKIINNDILQGYRNGVCESFRTTTVKRM
jgi:hypothetical protein